MKTIPGDHLFVLMSTKEIFISWPRVAVKSILYKCNKYRLILVGTDWNNSCHLNRRIRHLLWNVWKSKLKFLSLKHLCMWVFNLLLLSAFFPLFYCFTQQASSSLERVSMPYHKTRKWYTIAICVCSMINRRVLTNIFVIQRKFSVENTINLLMLVTYKITEDDQSLFSFG